MMTTDELHRRLDAIARYDGWEPDPEDPALYHKDGQRELLTALGYDRSWDDLMPVVEKIATDGGRLTYEYFPLSEVHKVLVWARSSHYDADIITRHADMKQAYFLAVSDYCLSLEPHPGGTSGVEEGWKQ